MGRVAVVGGRGKTGRAIAAALTSAGGEARALGRAELQDPTAALSGCDAVYLIAPNMHPDEPALVDRVLTAARASGIDRIVYHSVAAPYLPEMPHHMSKAESERLVRSSEMAWTILQPGVYMQNYLPQLSAEIPMLTVPYDPHQRFTFVDLLDVAEVAAAVLDGERHAGATLELGGPEHLSVHDVAKQAQRVLRREVPVNQIPTRAWAAGPGAAVESRERAWLIAMFDYYSAHGLLCGSVATRALLGREPTRALNMLGRNLGRN